MTFPMPRSSRTPGAPPNASSRRHRRAGLLVPLLALLLCTAVPAQASQEWFVAVGGTGNGTAAAPLGSIQAALQAAQPGDTITVQPGTYKELLTTVRGGQADAPITVRSAKGRGSVVVARSGQVANIRHAYVVVDGLVFDGGFAAADAVRVTSAANFFVLRNAEVRRSGRDCIDMAGPTGVLIEKSSINHCLWWDGARQDAHAIVAGPVRDLTLRELDIHTFSGDGLQLDPGRSLPGWDNVVVEKSTFRLAPLPTSQNGFPAGVVPGENGIDTKTNASAPRGRMTITDTTAEGFGAGLITNMAAFNLKEQVDVTVDRATVSRSEIAFRVRGPGSNGGAWVRLRNAVVHDVTTGIRYEDDIEVLDVAFTTFGRNVTRPIRAASSGWGGVTVANTLVLGTSLPQEAPAAAGNLVVSSAAFVNAAANDYQLTVGSPAIDAARAGAEVAADRIGTTRPQGVASDVGAYERPVAAQAPAAPTGLGARALLSGAKASVSLSWRDTATNETAFELQRSVNGTSFSALATPAANTTTFVDTTVARRTRYWYRVRAVNAAGASAFSGTVSVTTK